jgi:hypothetical protein
VQRRISLFEPPRFFTPLRSVQNDMNFHSFLTATSYKFPARLFFRLNRRFGGLGRRPQGKLDLAADIQQDAHSQQIDQQP